MSRLPLVVILGATGSGKTRLSLELAQKFSGEILGADSMQIYKSLDIITAKATKDEQSRAPHHLIDILEPHETCTVIDYRNKALKIIHDLLKQEKLPIIVGGTNYYIESLLWKILIDDDIGKESSFNFIPGYLPNNEHTLSSEELHDKLKLVDYVTANRIHPSNKRKIIRALDVFYKKKRKLSEILKEQQSAEDSSTSGGGLRFSNAIILWLQCDQAILDKRVNDRVDTMIEQGLVQELLDFHKKYNEKRLTTDSEPDYTRGIFQSIGFKEFHPYLMLSPEMSTTVEGRKKLSDGIEQLKMVTRRYARKQRKWIVNRFLARNDRKVPPIYGLDTSDISKWTENVTKTAEQIISCYITSSECKHQTLMKQNTSSTPNSLEESHICEICDRIFVGNHQWKEHLKSNRHRKRIEKKNKNLKQIGCESSISTIECSTLD